MPEDGLAVQSSDGSPDPDLGAVDQHVAGLRELGPGFWAAFHSSPVGMTLAELSGRLIAINAAFSRMIDRPAQALLGCEIFDFMVPEERSKARARLSQLVSGGRGYSVLRRYLRSDGTAIYGQLSVTTLGHGAHRYVLGQAIDQTATMRVQQRLAAAERYQRVLAEAGSALSREMESEPLVAQAAARAALTAGVEICFVGLLDDEPTSGEQVGAVRVGAVETSLPGMEDVRRQVFAVSRERPLLLSDELAHEVARRGVVRLPVLPYQVLPPPFQPVVRQIGPLGMIAMTLTARGRLLGGLVGLRDARRPLTDDDVTLLQALSDRVAVALDNARLLATAKRELAERQRAEQAERARAAQQEAVARLGHTALRNLPADELANEVLQTAVTILQADRAALWEALPGQQRMLLRAAAGWPEPAVGRHSMSAAPETLLGHALAADEPVMSVLAIDTRFGSGDAVAPGAQAAAAVRIDGPDGPYGVLTVSDARARSFTVDDAAFLSGLAAVLAGALRREKDERRLRHQALHDALTGLPNRALLSDRLAQIAASARRQDRPRPVALVLLDLDRFKLVNDSYGHAVGDELLRVIAARLRSSVRAGDTVARLGGDEFVVLCEDVTGESDLLDLVRRLHSAIARPVLLSIGEVYPSASSGIAISSGRLSGPDEVDVLLRNADAAMYRAKERGGGRWELFDASMQERVMHRLSLERRLRRAIADGELVVHYQPVIDLRSGRVDGVEALLRWPSQEFGWLEPRDFLDVAEESGLVVDAGQWMLDELSRQLLAWRGGPAAGLRLGLNLSGRQLVANEFVGRLAEFVEQCREQRCGLVFEVSEAAIARDVAAATELLVQLADRGAHVAMDDFGTGSSSLSQLKRLPVHALKIDHSLVAELGVDADGDRSIVASIVALGHALGMSVTAEGVETKAQRRAVRELGCDYAQGFHIARPMPGYELGEWVARTAPTLD